MHAFAAVGYALFHRSQTGEGQWLDLSMVDTMFHFQDIALQAHTLSGGQFIPHRAGHHHRMVCPFGVFKGPSGYLVILALQPQWKSVCEALGRPELEQDPRFVSTEARARHQQELIPIEAINNPYFESRGMVRRIEDPVLGQMIIPGFPFKFSAQPERADLVAPLLGEHNAAVLSRLLGYDADRIAALEAGGVLHSAER